MVTVEVEERQERKNKGVRKKKPGWTMRWRGERLSRVRERLRRRSTDRGTTLITLVLDNYELTSV